MNSSPSSSQTIRFGAFVFDLRARELRKQGAKIKLQEQPFQILAMLLEHPGDVVTREELRSRLWPSDTFVDFDHGLNKAINKLREALEDSVETPRLIKTLAKRGYQFLGDLKCNPARIESLLVLPLENLSGNPEQEYFADGLTEALITKLARINALRVLSRTTAMHYKRVRKPLPEVARELQVEGVVEGTVLRSGKRVRICAQLIHAPTDTHLWAESYDRELRDVLALQSQLAQAIAHEIQINLTPQEQAQFEHQPRVDPEAYEAYLQGRYYWNRRSREGHAKSVQSFQQAIAKDPNYAAAHAGLADSLSILGLWGLVPPEEGCGRAKSLAAKALELDITLAEAHVSQAWSTAHYDYDFAAAERGFERALELNPRSATAHHWFGMTLAAMGRYEEGYTELQRAIRLDPHLSVIHFGLAFVYWCGRRFDNAIAQGEKSLELDPNSVQAHFWLALTYLALGESKQAIASARNAVELSNHASVPIASLSEAYAAAGETVKAENLLNDLSKQRYASPYFVARAYLALGRKDEAIHRLESALAEHAEWMVLLGIDPQMDSLRGDPRFRELLRLMKPQVEG